MYANETASQNAVLVFSMTKEQIFSGKTLEELEEFFLQARFPFASKSTKIVILTRFPFLFRRKKTLSKKLQVMSYLTFVLRSYLGSPHLKEVDRLSIFSKEGSKKARDVLFDLESMFLRKSIQRIKAGKKSIYLVVTQTYFNKIPRFMQIEDTSILRVMLWYSINSEPIFRNGENSSFSLPKHFIHDIDLHLAWSPEHRDWLGNLGAQSIEEVGSMVFLPFGKQDKRKIQGQPFRTRTIVFFDVTPKQVPSSLYTPKASIQTLKSLVSIIESISSSERNVQLLVKPKRRYSRKESREYIEFVRAMAHDGRLQLLGSDQNIYSLIASADAVVAAPHSSPALIARELGVASIFFFIQDQDWQLPESFFGIPTLTDELALKKWLESSIC
jgi:polysaccharide biosynthesis PFTS motif protein